MYKLLRNLHLVAGLFTAVFLGAYASSAAQMAYMPYNVRPTETVSRIVVPEEVDTTARALARWLMAEHDVRGDLMQVSDKGGSMSLTITRPGTTQRVVYDADTRTATVTAGTLGTLGMLDRLHYVSGVRHDYWGTNAWGWSLFALSLSLLVLGTTGVILWFQRHTERLTGAVVLAVGLAWGAAMLVLVRMA